MGEQRRVSLSRTVFSFGWRRYEMAHPQLTWGVLYVVFVLGLTGTFAVVGIGEGWAFVAGGLIALSHLVALEARYRRRHPSP